MQTLFSKTLAELRRRAGKNQREVAADLGISQALLSHYENGAREPGLAFVCRACDYFGVTADYLLGRSQSGETVAAAELRPLLEGLRELTRQAEELLEPRTETN